MEALLQSLDDASEANPSSIKSDDSSPHHDNSRGSPPPNCAICLGKCRNKSFTDSCLHQFCFNCLVTWSKVKAECPLCKQNFKSIIYNVRANHQYEEYQVEQHQDLTQRIDIDTLTNRRFRYRTTLTLPRRESIAIQQLLLQHYPLVANVLSPPRRRRSPASFRRTVYRHNLWARPLPDFTGRFRDCTPEFYRCNDTQMHRLVPWLNRELGYLLNDNVGHISYVLTRILEMLPCYHITSTEFRDMMHRFFGDRTDHFLHELYCFASTPYDMTGYDRNVQYTTDSRISTMVNEVISSSESDASIDSDIVMVSSSSAADLPAAGPSGLPRAPPRAPPRAALSADSVIPIETISHSDTDDDSSEVMVVGYIKPPQDRTPEVVDLVGSDSDVVVAETPQPQPGPSEARTGPCVKLTLKRDRPREGTWSGSDTDESYRPPGRRRRRPRSADSATTADTRRTTPEPPSSTSLSTGSSDADDSSTDTSDADDRRTTLSRKKIRRKNGKEAAYRRERNSSTRRPSSVRRRDKKDNSDSSRQDRDRRNKKKSHSGKGVKCSRRLEEEAPESRGAEQPARKLRSVVTVMDGRGAPSHSRTNVSDSDDDLPLNLTVHKLNPPSDR